MNLDNNALDALCNASLAEWGLDQNQILAKECALTVGKDNEVMQAIKTIRKNTLVQWRAWQNEADVTKKDAAYTTLQATVIAELQSLWGKEVSWDNECADMMIRADLTAYDYVAQMLDRLRGARGKASVRGIESLMHLYFMVLGCPFSQQGDYHEKPIRAVGDTSALLSDIVCARECVAVIISQYRRVYDELFASVRDRLELTFLNERDFEKRGNEARALVLRAKEEWYQGVVSNDGDAELLRLWRDIEAQARASAHQSTQSKMRTMLDEVWEAMISFHARLQVLQTSDAMVRFPDATHAQTSFLAPEHARSILIGLLRAVTHEVLEKKHAAVRLEAAGRLFVAEMNAQREANHIRTDVPAGGEKKKSFSSSTDVFKDGDAARRMSYEVRMYVVAAPKIDFIRGEGEMEQVSGKLFNHVALSKALQGMAASDGLRLYHAIAREYGFLNAISWNLVSGKTTDDMLKRMAVLAQKVREYCEKIGIKVSSLSEIQASFRACITGAATWQGATEVSFKNPRSLREVLASGKKDEAGQAQVYQNMFKLLWVCVVQRFFSIITTRGQEPVGGEESEMAPVFAAEDERGEEQSKARAFAESIKEKVSQAPDALRESSKQLMRQFEMLQQEAATKFADSGDVTGVFDQLNSMLGGIGEFVPQLTTSMNTIFTESEQALKKAQQEAQRVMVTLKASLVYMHTVGEFLNKKIAAVQGALEALGKNPKIRAASWVVSKFAGPGIKKAIEEVSQEDREMQLQMQTSFDEMMAAWHGKREVEDIKAVNLDEGHYRKQVQEHTKHTSEGILKTMVENNVYDLDGGLAR